MTVLVVPPFEEGEAWPTLGPQVCEYLQAYAVHGPGDLRGEPARISNERRAIIYRLYEVYAEDHPQAGRRRFKRAGLSERKGSAKTEFAAWIAQVELDPDGPVRCAGFDGRGQPIARPVVDPYIPLVAYTEEQTEDLAYGALRVMLEEGPRGRLFDIGLERIMRKAGDGVAKALASAPSARDGARTTFQHFDETHRFTLPNLKRAHTTMLANIPKRRAADAWSLETTTAYEPGAGSIAEGTHDYARKVDEGTIKDSSLFFFHRQASDKHDLDTEAGLRAAILEASGPEVAEWTDIEGIMAIFQDPSADISYQRRVWTNIPLQGSEKAFDLEAWRKLGRDDYTVADGALITLGFDGARSFDTTGLVGTEIKTGYQWVVGVWERPAHLRDEEYWEVPASEVDETVEATFERYQVWRMYADPPYWDAWIATWAGRHGKEVVVEWWTNRLRQMAYAIKSWVNAIARGELTHEAHRTFERHVGNAVKRTLHLMDEDGKTPLWLIQKERPDSPQKIDLDMAAILSWEARMDALAAGLAIDEEPSVYEERGLLVI